MPTWFAPGLVRRFADGFISCEVEQPAEVWNVVQGPPLANHHLAGWKIHARNPLGDWVLHLQWHLLSWGFMLRGPYTIRPKLRQPAQTNKASPATPLHLLPQFIVGALA